MYRQLEVRSALSPLGDVVETVSGGAASYVGVDGVPNPGSEHYTIYLNTDDPDSFQDQIGSLLRGAGLADIPIEIKRNPEQGKKA